MGFTVTLDKRCGESVDGVRYVVSMESIEMLPVSERWHPHMYALEVAVDTGLPGLIGYGLFSIPGASCSMLGLVALTSLVVILALFPLNSWYRSTPISTATFCSDAGAIDRAGSGYQAIARTRSD